MNIKLTITAFSLCAAFTLSSCVYPAYASTTTTYTPGGVVSTTTQWTSAQYDAAGFPIYGYSYGRPVYGYTAAGVAVFTFAAITAACLVPNWGPAANYRGSWRYPSRVVRHARPVRVPAGHRPGYRPSHKPHHPAVKPHAPSHRPAVKPHVPSHRPAAKPHAPSHRPAAKPHGSSHRPSHGFGGHHRR